MSVWTHWYYGFIIILCVRFISFIGFGWISMSSNAWGFRISKEKVLSRSRSGFIPYAGLRSCSLELLFSSFLQISRQPFLAVSFPWCVDFVSWGNKMKLCCHFCPCCSPTTNKSVLMVLLHTAGTASGRLSGWSEWVCSSVCSSWVPDWCV